MSGIFSRQFQNSRLNLWQINQNVNGTGSHEARQSAFVDLGQSMLMDGHQPEQLPHVPETIPV